MLKKIIPKWNVDGSCAEDSENKTFCMAPWTHTYISPQGERRMCCASREEHSFQKQYIDATNDEKYGETRESETDIEKFNPITLADSMFVNFESMVELPTFSVSSKVSYIL